MAATVLVVSVFLLADLCAQDVADVRISGLKSVSEDTVREVIGIRPGEQFSFARLERAVDNLRKWGVFDTIDVIPSASADGEVIEFLLKEAVPVVSIDITGNYPYVENKVRKYLTLHPGDIYTPDRLSEQIERVKAFYAREGYVGTEVYVSEDLMPEWGGVVLTFHIKRGAAMRYRNISVEGNRAYPAGQFVSAFNPYRQFSERRFSESIRKIREFYHNHGYPRSRIKVKSKRMDFEAHRVDVELEVYEGPKVELIFKGASHISRRVLKRTITILREGSVDDFEIDTSADAIKELMRERGYPDAKVEGGRTEKKDGTLIVTFTIEEGKEQRIRWLNFRGNEGVSSSDLTEGMKNKEQASGVQGTYAPDEKALDTEAILKALRRHGYLNGRVGDWKVAPTKQGYALDVTIPIEEGVRTIVGEVSFSGNNAFDVARLLRELKIRPGKPFDEPGLPDDRQRLMEFYADNGYPYAEITQSFNVDEDKNTASIRYEIAEGSLVHIGEVLIIGDAMTSQKAIKHAMEIGSGDVFSFRKIIDSQLNIRRLGAFSAVNIETIGLEEREPIVHIKVKVEEQRPFQVDLGLAYSTDEGLTGSLLFANVNAFGWAKTNTLRLIGGRKTSRAEIGWTDPRFLSSSFEMSTIGWIQYRRRPTFAYTQLGGTMGWFRRFRRFGFFFRYELDRNYFVAGDSVAADADSLRNSTISRISLSSSYDSRDSFSDPKRGFFTLGGVDIFNEIRGKHANFVKFYWQGENDLTYLTRLTLSTALRFNRIQTFGHNVSVPTNELYYLGGNDTLRGYPEDSLGPVDAAGNATGSRTRWIMNEELRFRIISALSWAFFYDMGSLTNDFDQISNFTIRKAWGVGLRYLTPVGPIRADYGFKIGRRPGESIGMFHFTFGYVF